jgi:hypothetical protein
MSEVDNGAQADNTADQLDTSSIVVNGGEEQKQGTWISSLEEGFRNDPSIQKFKDVNSLAKSYTELQKLVGKEKVVIPKDDASPEEKASFFKKLGMPDEASKYETPELEVAEEIRMQDHTLESFKAKAHELGLTKKQFAELYAFQQEMSQNEFNNHLESTKKTAEKTEFELRKEFGVAYEAKIKGAQEVINTFFKGKDIGKSFSVLANDKGFVKAMAEVAEKLGEDVLTGTARSTKTPAEAQSEINAIMGDPKSAYYNDLHPEHKAVVDKVIALQQMASF